MEPEITSVGEVGGRGALVKSICFQTHIDPWIHSMGCNVTSEGGTTSMTCTLSDTQRRGGVKVVEGVLVHLGL